MQNFLFFKLEIEIAKKCHKKSYSDDLTEIKNREITGNFITEPHLGRLPGSGNVEEFQLQLGNFLQVEQNFWTRRSLNFLLFMKTLVFLFRLMYINIRFYILTINLGNIESLARKKVTKPDTEFTGLGQN